MPGGDLIGAAPAPGSPLAAKMSYMLPKQQHLQAAQSKGLELTGTFARKTGTTGYLLTIANKALAPMTDFAIQFNKNR